MLTIAALRLVVGIALAGVIGAVIAVISTGGGWIWLDWAMDRKDQKAHDKSGWKPRSAYPVVGEPNFAEKLQKLYDGTL